MFTIPESVTILHGEYSPSIVALSVILACCASYTALSMNDRIQQNSFFHRFFWLLLASAAMGFGIWSMHFIGMGAFMLPVEMSYDLTLTVLSIIPAMIASILAFYIANEAKRSLTLFILSGMIMGTGISAMHYIGMAAMKMDIRYAYKPFSFALSVVIAMVVSFIALYIFSSMKHLMGNGLIKSITAVIMGLGISSMHYTGMASVTFFISPEKSHMVHMVHRMDNTVLVTAVAIGTIVLLLLSGLSGIIDKYVEFRMNSFDLLTQLPNRRQFERALKSHSSSMVGLVHIHNLDKWNLSYGYRLGDYLLSAVGRMLAGKKTAGTGVYRIQGNRFAVVGRELEVKEALESFSAAVRQPLIIQGHELLIDTVISYSSRKNKESGEELFANALAVLHHSSITYKNQVIQYDPGVHTYNLEQQLISDIERAMEEHELYLVYQPKICAATKEVKGLEALIRWIHPEHGFLSPALFIPVLERSGKMVGLTDWIIKMVCEQIVDWKREGRPVIQVGINIPGTYITSSRLLDTLNNFVESYGIHPENIELEITETSVISDIENAIRAVGEFRKNGYSVALDDFGTGVSSLSYLKRLPISTLKIDKSFVDGVPGCNKDSAIISAIISLCHSLDIETVIEGVETENQYDYLHSLSSQSVIQGYYFAKPMKAEEIAGWRKGFIDEHSGRMPVTI
ncbi:EAL domain-containing protein [Peribacillus sp. SCS-37]|uniref:bifunctional diguanylate cyclase/phosphodiesterase n=1 Tax=Paraperibacillus esterisolvens TaxID=3115296 RepID=UPI003905CEEA